MDRLDQVIKSEQNTCYWTNWKERKLSSKSNQLSYEKHSKNITRNVESLDQGIKSEQNVSQRTF